MDSWQRRYPDKVKSAERRRGGFPFGEYLGGEITTMRFFEAIELVKNEACQRPIVEQ